MKSVQKILRQINDLQHNWKGGMEAGQEWFDAVATIFEEILRDLREEIKISAQLLTNIKFCTDMVHSMDFSKQPITQIGMNVIDKVMDEVAEELTIAI